MLLQVPVQRLENILEKQAVVNELVLFLDHSIVRWCEEVDLASLCSSNHKQLLELKVSNGCDVVNASCI